jgi:PAS domain S-box-containing protein
MQITISRTTQDKDSFPKQLEAMRQRVRALYRRGSASVQNDEVLSAAFEELAVALEVLHATGVERQEQYEAWLDERVALEAECQRYQDLFTDAPAGYLVTNLDGTIRQANAMAAKLLQTDEKWLTGRSLALFVPDGHRRTFRSAIARLREAEQQHPWEVRLQPWSGSPFDAELHVALERGQSGRPLALRWLLHDISHRKQVEERMHARVAELEQRLHVLEAQPLERGAGEPPADQEAGAELLQRHCAFLAEASTLLAVAYDVEATLSHVAHLAVPTIADGCMIELLDNSDGVRWLVVTHAEGAQDQRTRTRWRQASTTQRQPRLLPLLSATSGGQPTAALIDASCRAWSQDTMSRAFPGMPAPSSAIVASFLVREHVLGAFALVSATAKCRYTQAHVTLAEEVARRIAIALDRRRSNEFGR